jgi:hypothetical protein
MVSGLSLARWYAKARCARSNGAASESPSMKYCRISGRTDSRRYRRLPRTGKLRRSVWDVWAKSSRPTWRVGRANRDERVREKGERERERERERETELER